MANESGQSATSQAQDGTPNDAAATAAAGAASTPEQDPVALLTSRLNGQTAKVNTLLAEKQAALDEAKTLREALEATRSEKVSADEAAKALVAEANKAIEIERTAHRADTLKVRFPETFAVLGDAAMALTEANLAANEARLTAGSGTPTPTQHSEHRSSAGAGTPHEETAAEAIARLEKMPMPVGW
jgi:cell wall-associated NlpC family hydrolase